MFTPVRAFVLAALVALAARADAAPTLKVMLLDGESGGPWHKWQLTTPVLKKQLEDTGMFQVDVVTAPSAGGDFTAFKPNFSAYRVVVWNYDAPDERWPAELKTSFEQYVTGGGGVVVVHGADNAFPGWTAFNQMIGIGGWRDRNEKAGPRWFMTDGALTSDPSPGSAGSHGRRVPFLVTTQNATHPITRGLPKTWMHQGDELYASLRGPGTNMTVLATGRSRPDNAGTDRDEPLLMALTFGKGRIFHTTLGHDVDALSCVGFTTAFQRGAEWAATGAVTQKLPATFPNATTVTYRADLAAMDPAFEKGLNRLDPPPPAATAAGHPFAGTWSITGDVAGNPVNSTCTFTVADAGTVGGTCKLPTGETKATGTVKGQTLTFEISVAYQGSDYVLVFTGTAQSPTTMKGTIEVSGAQGDFTATKQ
jgi:type 1 glutamine amidotransferase